MKWCKLQVLKKWSSPSVFIPLFHSLLTSYPTYLNLLSCSKDSQVSGMSEWEEINFLRVVWMWLEEDRSSGAGGNNIFAKINFWLQSKPTLLCSRSYAELLQETCCVISPDVKLPQNDKLIYRFEANWLGYLKKIELNVR